jgi:hypothetical protein
MNTLKISTHLVCKRALILALTLSFLPACIGGSRRDWSETQSQPEFTSDPALDDSTFQILEDAAASLDLPTPRHMDLDTLAYDLVEAPYWGSLDLSSSPPVYVPMADFAGSDSFT